MNTYEMIKKRLIFLCNEKGITINKLATNSNLTPSTVYSLLNEERHDIGVVVLKKLCDGLDISISDFFDSDIFRDLEQEIK